MDNVDFSLVHLTEGQMGLGTHTGHFSVPQYIVGTYILDCYMSPCFNFPTYGVRPSAVEITNQKPLQLSPPPPENMHTHDHKIVSQKQYIAFLEKLKRLLAISKM